MPSGPLHAQRNSPPTRRSSSHLVIDQPGGPKSHCLISSGFDIASQTRSLGALKERVKTISRSVGVATLRRGLLMIFSSFHVIRFHCYIERKHLRSTITENFSTRPTNFSLSSGDQRT